MIKVSVNGALGKMGSTVCNAVINNSETELIDSVDINSKKDFQSIPTSKYKLADITY